MKVFGINFLFFSILFIGIYLLAASRGAPELSNSGMSIVHSVFGGVIVIAFFSFWGTMLMHCFKTANVKKKPVWIFGMAFLPWVILVVYFFVVYMPERRSSR